MPSFELYHRISDLDCAYVRRLITELGLVDQVRFRNVDTGAEALADLKARTGADRVPALWIGEEMLVGREPIEQFLNDISSEKYPELAEQFDQLAASVWQDLQNLIPAEMKKNLVNVQFLLVDEPTAEILAELPEELREDPQTLCGLMFGTPLTETSVMNPEIEPARIFLFRWALLDLLDLDDLEPEKTLKTEIAITLLHEIGHYFGLSEDDLERLGYD